MPPANKLEFPTNSIDISSLDNEHSDDLAYASFHFAREVEIAHSFTEGNDSDLTSGETNMVRFRTLGLKKSAPMIGRL